MKMATRAAASNQKLKPLIFERIEKDTSCVLSPNSTHELMQNCDLPPPIKLFSGQEGVFLSSTGKNCRMGRCMEVEDKHLCACRDWLGDDKMEILKALQLSQTRAREAERRVGVLSEEKDRLSNMIVDESMRFFAHRQWVRLMEIEVIKLQNRKSCHTSTCNCAEKSMKRENRDKSNSNKQWCTAIALCLAIAGMSFVVGCRYLL